MVTLSSLNSLKGLFTPTSNLPADLNAKIISVSSYAFH